MEYEIITSVRCALGEGPVWHPEEKRLYWLDIPAGRVHRYDPDTRTADAFDAGCPVGGMTIQRNGELVLFMQDGAVAIRKPGGLRRLIRELPEERGNRFNDVIADPAGRVFAGVLSTRERAGRLYRIEPDLKVSVTLEGTGTANGMGFTPDLRGMYFTDTRQSAIFLFDYDRVTGAMSSMRIFARTDHEGPGNGRPDGLTVDAEGCVWSARWDGGCVVRYAPDGKEMMRVRLPAQNVTSVAFGGEDLSDLYITTAGGEGAAAGALFRMVPGVKGRAEFRSELNDGLE